MRHYAAIFLFLLMACLMACGRSPEDVSAPRNVFGMDNRVALGTALPWSAVGKLDSGCTGTLVGKNLVLTAAHCIMDERNHTPLANLGTFRPAFTAGGSREAFAVTYAWWGTTYPDNNRGADWAILRLSGNAGDTYGWLGVTDPVFYNLVHVKLAGYSADFQNGQTASIDIACDLHGLDENGILMHDCDMTRGSSGGPLLQSMGAGIQTIVGVSAGERRNGGDASLFLPSYSADHANLGAPASAFLATLRIAN